MGEKGLVRQLGLAFEPDLVAGLVVPHCMLEDHHPQSLLHHIVGKSTVINEGYDLSV